MYEHSLYGQVERDHYAHIVQQLTGVTRMRSKPVQQLHLVFRAQVPSGLRKIPSAGDAATKQDVQRVSKMLTANLYFVHIVGEIQGLTDSGEVTNEAADNGTPISPPQITWYLEFKDTPDPGKQSASGRMVSRTQIDDGDIGQFMNTFGYDYMNRYIVKGEKFFDQDLTLFLYRVYRVPAALSENAADCTFLASKEGVSLFDASGGYILQASLDAADGSTAELKDRASAQLLAMRDRLKDVVALTPGDRLAMDMRAPAKR